MNLKMYKNLYLVFLIVTFFALITGSGFADVKLPAIIDSDMVLQRNEEIRIFGWADPGEKVTISFCGQTAGATGDENGKWLVKLSAMKEGGPFEMAIKGNNEIKLSNILIGDVWLCSGQSNMERGLNTNVDGGKEAAATADFPSMRFFKVERSSKGQPQPDVNAKWAVCTPKTASRNGPGGGGFTAVGFFFGRQLHQELNVPIGLIEATWGGTAIEPWTPEIGFKLVESIDHIARINRTINGFNESYAKQLPEKVPAVEQWLAEYKSAIASKKPLPIAPDWPTHPLDKNYQPTALYNGMLNGIVPFRIKGAIWYQGEQNHTDGMRYADKTEALLKGWRKVWNIEDMPFYFVQIAPYDYPREDPQLLPAFWQAQFSVPERLSNCDLILTMDIGNIRDIHPRDKLTVGKRLAGLALHHTYGMKDLIIHGPIFKQMTVSDGKATISFTHTDGGLKTRDGKDPDWFEIAGADKKFVRASAKIVGENIVTYSPEVKEPVAVRFGWNKIAEPNLQNGAGLPARPFNEEKP